ncbi:vanadium-dependent haloperoxidase [Clostridium sp.]|uniref:vanadium-dependent haloperoxidase n=1 Tax=Clostridium sp. TaxID=1506 RepID=UPI002FC9C532
MTNLNNNLLRNWSILSYGSETYVPSSEDPLGATWPTYFLQRNDNGQFIDNNGKLIQFPIHEPDTTLDFNGKQLNAVKKTLNNITPTQIAIAKYWGTGPATKQWTPIIDILIDTYKVTAFRAARILAAVHAALNDAFAVTWYFKYLWKVPRPNQFDQDLVSILPMPKHPSYPAGHGVVAGCAEVVLSYFFECEAHRLHQLAEECAISRLFAGVHYPTDNIEGLTLGRYIGEIVVENLRKQGDGNLCLVDYPIKECLNAKLPPPPYRQVISNEQQINCIYAEDLYVLDIVSSSEE